MIEESTYIPFQDGLLIAPPFNINKEIINHKSSSNQINSPKCEYCGKPAQHANCHGHSKGCPYSCDFKPALSINGDYLFSILIIIYIIIKKFKK